MELFNYQRAQPSSSLQPFYDTGNQVQNQAPPGGPLASALQSQGRGDDSMLVHMTPGEVNSLRGLAQQFGGDLTTNPATGLPEAGFLSSILPVVAGGLLTLVSGGALSPLLVAGLTGAAGTAITGDLSKGLMAGLGAFGGASLAGSLAASATPSTVLSSAGSTANPAPLAGTLASGAETAGSTVASAVPTAATAAAPAGFVPSAVAGPLSVAPINTAALSVAPPSIAPTGFLDKFAAASRQGLPATGMMSKAAPYAAGLGLLNAGSMALQPELPKYEEEEETPYRGPYKLTPRRVLSPQAGLGSREQLWFSPREGEGIYGSGAGGYAAGGEASYDFRGAKDIVVPEAVRQGSVDQIGGLGNIPLPAVASSSPYNAEWVKGLSAITAKAPNKVDWAAYVNANPDALAHWGSNDPGVAAMKAAGMGLGDFGRFHYANDGMKRDITPFQIKPPTTFGFQPTTNVGSRERVYNFTGASGLKSLVPTPPPVDMANFVPPFGFAAGGEAIQDGSFIVDARTVSEIGNGSSNAGIEALARMGGTPIQGPGDGASDSIKASLEGQPARVARDEVKFSPQAVKKLGGGSHQKGVEKLYGLMRKAHNARKKAGRGSDTKMSAGLASL